MSAPSDREYVLVFSNRASISLLAVTWIMLLVTVIVLLRRNRTLRAQMDAG